VELPKRIAENIDRFTGRVWLLPRLLEWWDRGDERIFLLTGDPGTGKSMILAWLAGYGPEPQDALAREQLSRVRKMFKAAHFCQAASRNITPQAFAESVANQLTSNVAGFAGALTATLAEQVQITATQTIGAINAGGTAANVSIGRIDLTTLGDELSFDRGFTQPLKKLYASGHSEPMLILVDALDEALGYTGDKTLPALLSTLGDLPPQVRLLATTRDEPRVLKFFRDMQPLDLIRDADADVDDVRLYADGRLAKLTAVEPVKRQEFAQRLAKQAGGVFLYAAMVLDELLEHPPSGLPDLDSYPLPDGLSGLYHTFLTRELGKDEQRWFDLYEPLLGLIAVAQGEGLTDQQLTDIIGKDIRAALRATKQYLSGELPDGPFRPFHKSFADFLLEDKDNVDYHIDSQLMHRRVTEHYWLKHRDDWWKSDDYGLAHLAGHLYQAGQLDQLTELISPAWMRVRVARDGYRYSGFVGDLMLAWQHAREDALRQIEADHDEFDAFAMCFRYALIRTSLNSLSSNYSPALVKRALETCAWSGDRALDIAGHLPDPAERAEMYAAVLAAGMDKLTNAQRDEARNTGVAAARTIKEEEVRADVLASLAPQLGGEQLGEALAAVRAIQNERFRAQVLAALAPQLGGEAKTEVLGEALAAVGAIQNDGDRAQMLARLAPQLSGEQLGEALAAARAIKHEGVRAGVLARLAPQLSGEQLDEALAAARAIEDEEVRADVLARLAEQLSGKLKVDVLVEALAAARAIEHKVERQK
jgi:hypothetical protein